MKGSLGVFTAIAAVAVIVLLAVGGALGRPPAGNRLALAAAGKLRPATLTMKKNGATVTRTLPFISAGTVTSVAEALGMHAPGADSSGKIDSDFSDTGGGKGTLGCAKRGSKGNQRVNQDCGYRRQSEEMITYNPADPSNLVAGQNDSRVGYNQCGIDWSTNNGRHWGDMLPPFRQHENAPEFMGPNPTNPNNNTILGEPGDFHTYDIGSDPGLAVDSQGRSYFSCVIFDVYSFASGVFVTQSPQGASGSFYFNVPSSVPTPDQPTPDKHYMVVEDDSLEVLHDKEFIAADRYDSSPNHDNVYVTWSVFRYDSTGQYQRSPIYGSMSTDHAATWSTPQEISGSSDTLCFFGNALDATQPEHACNFDQAPSPVVLPNGNLVVAFNNGNTNAGNPNGQQLAVVCHPTGSSSAGSANLNCGTPSKVGDDVTVGEPVCDFGRGPEQCVPGPYVRSNDFPRITQDNTQNGRVYVVWQDYRNQEYDIHMATSVDGGVTWSDAGQVNPDTGLDHYFPATDQTPNPSERNGVSYFRSERIPGENDTPAAGFSPGQPGVQQGNSDYVLAGGKGPSTPYDFTVVSPVFPPPDGNQSGFNGDYSGLTVNRGDDAHPIWSDTRNVSPFTATDGVIHDEDVFTDKVGLPNGKAKPGPGTIGKGGDKGGKG